MRFLIIFFALFLYSANIDKKIKTTKKTLSATKTKISTMNNKLDTIIKKINQEENYLSNLKNQIKRVNTKISNLQKSLKEKNKSLTNLEKQQQNLIEKKSNLEKKVIDFVSNNYYIQNANIVSEQDLINEEILKVVAKESAKKMETISNLYSQINTKIKQISKMIYDIKHSKEILQNKRKELATLQNKRKKYIERLQAIKLKYKKELNKIIASQNRLQNQLAKLNIIKTKELRKQRELANRRLTTKNSTNIDKVKVKNYGNIYMKTKTARYRGAKTIPPVRGIITKKFGAYKDPVYHIALYNDSITIKTKPNTKVRAIFSGKVVFVSNTSDGKIIVIKHKNNLHSIYAKLSKVSPFIKKGYRVKKGEVIAKVNNELEFEITYKTLPINPLQVINF